MTTEDSGALSAAGALVVMGVGLVIGLPFYDLATTGAGFWAAAAWLPVCVGGLIVAVGLLAGVLGLIGDLWWRR